MGIPSLACFILPKNCSPVSAEGQHPGLYPPFGAHKIPGLFALKDPGPSSWPMASQERKQPQEEVFKGAIIFLFGSLLSPALGHPSVPTSYPTPHTLTSGSVGDPTGNH